jgi:endoglucanase
MNEPHDLDVPTWATSCQAAVTAIRNTGASSQMILLPGTNFASAGQFVSSGSAAELIKITNPDGSFDGLILDLHKYLDVDNSGTHTTCTTDNIADAFAIAADFLRSNGRKALVSETGAGTDSTVRISFHDRIAPTDLHSASRISVPKTPISTKTQMSSWVTLPGQQAVFQRRIF